MIHVPKAHEVLDPDGALQPGVSADWHGYFGRAFDQMVWWASAAQAQRAVAAPPGAFTRDPSQRNAP